MSYCNECGYKLDSNDEFCPSCGTTALVEQVSSEKTSFASQAFQGAYCISCGSMLDQGVAFCSECGASSDSKSPQPVQLEARQQTSPGYGSRTPAAVSTSYKQTSAPTRIWINWMIISLCTMGIGYLVYIYLNFEDTRSHWNRHHLSKNIPNSERLDTDPNLVIIMLLLCFFYIPIFILIFIKHEKMYKHLTYEGAYDRGVSGAAALVISICTFGIGLLFIDYKWQELFNEHLIRSANA
ncbi:MAG: zinc-ribbon domain-containing protein [Candidatus Heimdallarchaeota archaeon]|nr:zinc-ribbon domain-containing protein [Candidatus Heimdallarchaeota archaeon]MCK5048642.1 zinc-ribbon domain-containing protein [Candidatus Heimdallarchaeota archaeon]